MPPDVQTYTWSQFVAAVLALLPADSQRIGPVQPYIQQLIRQAVINLQNYIPALCKNHETLYQASDFVGEGWASRATLPPQARVQDAFLVFYDTKHGVPSSPSHCERRPLDNYPWANRMALVDAKVAVNNGRGLISFDPTAETFYIYPVVRDTQNVSIFWDGKKINFQDNELTPFDEQTVMAVAQFCKRELVREVDKDLALNQSHAESYAELRRNVYLDLKERQGTTI